MMYNYLFKSNNETKISRTASRNPVKPIRSKWNNVLVETIDRAGPRSVQHPSIVNTIERDLTTGRDGRFETLKLLQRVANSGPVAHETTLTLKPAYCYRLGKT